MPANKYKEMAEKLEDKNTNKTSDNTNSFTPAETLQLIALDQSEKYLEIAKDLGEILSINFLNQLNLSFIEKLKEQVKTHPLAFNSEALKEAKEKLKTIDYRQADQKALLGGKDASNS